MDKSCLNCIYCKLDSGDPSVGLNSSGDIEECVHPTYAKEYTEIINLLRDVSVTFNSGEDRFKIGDQFGEICLHFQLPFVDICTNCKQSIYKYAHEVFFWEEEYYSGEQVPLCSIECKKEYRNKQLEIRDRNEVDY